MFKVTVLADRIDAGSNQRHDNNIGTLRLIGALAVLFGHNWPLSQGAKVLDPISQAMISLGMGRHPVQELGVCLFFTLSGLLITQSFERRHSTLAYLEARLLRIFPALIATVALMVFVLGPLYTTMPLADYFRERETWVYLVSTASLWRVEFSLPGVFKDLPYPSVNGSLWTLHPEFKLYLWVLVFGLLTLLRKPLRFNVLAVVLVVLYLSATAQQLPYALQPVPFNNAYLGGYFLLGAFAYINRAKIPLSPLVLLALIALCVLLHGTAAYEPAFGVSFAYLTLLVAYHPRMRLPAADRHGDFSYGIYLYAFPIQQALITQLQPLSPWLLLLPSLALTSLAAAGSWFLIEKPSLRLKGKLLPRRLPWRRQTPAGTR